MAQRGRPKGSKNKKAVVDSTATEKSTESTEVQGEAEATEQA